MGGPARSRLIGVGLRGLIINPWRIFWERRVGKRKELRKSDPVGKTGGQVAARKEEMSTCCPSVHAKTMLSASARALLQLRPATIDPGRLSQLRPAVSSRDRYQWIDALSSTFRISLLRSRTGRVCKLFNKIGYICHHSRSTVC